MPATTSSTYRKFSATSTNKVSLLDALISSTTQSEVPAVATQHGPLFVGLQVRVTGGKYNGLVGKLVKLDLTPGGAGAVRIYLEESKIEFEAVVEQHFLEGLESWKARRTATELQLKGQ